MAGIAVCVLTVSDLAVDKKTQGPEGHGDWPWSLPSYTARPLPGGGCGDQG
jgi:hypothetical protein